jgi:hypothetical protein
MLPRRLWFTPIRQRKLNRNTGPHYSQSKEVGNVENCLGSESSLCLVRAYENRTVVLIRVLAGGTPSRTESRLRHLKVLVNSPKGYKEGSDPDLKVL